MEKKTVIHVDLCRSRFGHLLFIRLVLTLGVSEVERMKQGQACVYVSIQAQDLSRDGRELADEFLCHAPFTLFCSVLLLCVIPGDVNWHASAC